MSKDFNYRINILIHERVQQENESFQNYFTQMELLFQKLSVTKSDAEKIEILKHNMKNEYKPGLACIKIRSLDELSLKCQALEAALKPTRNIPTFRRKFNVQVLDQAIDTEHDQDRAGNRRFTSGNNKEIKCWNCEGNGHGHRECRKKIIFCYRCGNKGVISRDCLKCQENR